MAKVILIHQRPEPGKGTTTDCIFKRPPNLGLAYIKASLEASGHKAVIGNVSSPGEARKLFSGHKDADCVGISSLTYTAGNAYRTASFFRSLQIPVLMGGVHASIFPLDAAPHADCVVVGEGEVLLPRLLETLESTGGFGTEKVIGAIKDASGKLVPDPKHRICDLDSLPPPKLEDVRQGLHPAIDGLFWSGIPFGVQITTSRGCPHNCSFCKVPFLQGRNVRAHSPDYIGRLLEKYHGEGARSFMFADDNFSFNTERVSDICKEIDVRGLDISWFCLCRSNWIVSNRALIKRMRDAGCAMIYFGMESASQYVLDGYGKGITPEDSLAASKILRREGIGMIVSVILGGERDTVETMGATLSMLEDIGPDMVQLAILTQLDELVADGYERYSMEAAIQKHPTIPTETLERTLGDFNIAFYGSRENQQRIIDNMEWVLEKSLPWMPGFLRRASFRHVFRTIAGNFKGKKFKQPQA